MSDHLGGISTSWSIVQEPVRFVVRYAPAILEYLWQRCLLD